MDIYEILFLIVISGSIAITANKVYNIYNYFYKKEIYSLLTCLLSFVGISLLWFFGMLVLLDNPTKLLYIVSFNLISLLMLVSLVLFIIELFCCMGWAAEQTYIQPYSAREERARIGRY